MMVPLAMNVQFNFDYKKLFSSILGIIFVMVGIYDTNYILGIIGCFLIGLDYEK
jgi:hypothetical protein